MLESLNKAEVYSLSSCYHLMKYLLFILLLAAGTCQGQDLQHNYYPIRPGKVPSPVLKELFSTNEKIAHDRPIPGAAVKKDFVKIIKASHKTIAQLDTCKTLMYQDTLARYVNSMVQRVIAANPELAGRKEVVFTLRDETVNAANHGPGIVSFNLGLLARANTYEEVIFIVCHELSHDYFDHYYESVEKYCNAIHDPQFRKKVRQLKRQEYNTVKRAELLAAQTISGLRRHDRKQELMADSMGYIFYKRLNLHPAHPIRDMQQLDSADIPFSHHTLNYRNYFDHENSFFDDEWLKVDSSVYFWAVDSASWEMPDSLKTHPDCKIRVEKLSQLIGPVTGYDQVPQEEFLYMRTIARFEMLEELLANEDYANALYYAMQLQDQFPHNIYVKNVALNSLIEMSNALKNHRFSQVVDHPNHYYHPRVNYMLHFLHNLNSTALRNMAIAYFKTNLQTIQNDAFTGYNAILMKSWDMKKEQLPGLVDLYKNNFKDRFYLKKLESKFKPKKK